MTDITLTFGKYNGKKFSEVPTSYVQWLSEQATICGKTVIPQAAKAFLAGSKQTSAPVAVQEASVNAPKTLQEAKKLGYAASKGNTAVKARLLACRDADGFIKVMDDDVAELVYVRKDGTVMEGYGALQLLSKAKVLAILSRYGMSDQAEYYTRYL